MRRLTAVDDLAAGLGLYPGQKAADAGALAPGLITDEAAEDADRSALIQLGDWCARFSPAVAEDPPDGLFLDITGVAHLWGGEAALVEDLLDRLGKNGLRARAGVAGTPGASWALAHFGYDRTLVPTEGEAAALAPLPVASLRLTPAIAEQIARLGLVSVGQLGALPRAAITRRFGEEVVRRLDQALGLACEALTFRRPPSPWLARLTFAEPISAPEDLARVTADIAVALCARLESEGQGARRFELAFHRLDGQAPRRAIGLSLPAREAGRIARLFLPRLETVDPGFGIEVVTLTAHEVEPCLAQQQRLDEPLASEAALAPLVDHLSNRLGAGCVWRAEALPSHVPERAVARRPPLSKPAGGAWDPRKPRPLRLFRRPEPIDAVAPAPDDPPVFFRWRGGPHRIRRAEGPERIAEEWWRRPLEDADPAKVRDYYRVEDEAGARFWVFRAGPYTGAGHARWWLHGLFG